MILDWIPEYVADGFIGALNGALGGVVLSVGCGIFPKPDQETLSACGRYQPLVHAMMSGSGWQRARTFALMSSVATGLYLAMLNIRGKDDFEARFVAMFGSGIAVSLATGLEGPEVISFGVLFALGNEGMFKLRDKLSMLKVKAEHIYVSHDNTGFFTGNALSLRTDHRLEAKKGGKRTWFC